MTRGDDSTEAADRQAPGWFDSLSIRLFLLTICAILLVEALIFVPSAAAFRASWLEDRAQAGRIASLAVEAAPSRDVSRELSNMLLSSAEVLAVTELADGVRYQILPPRGPIPRPVVPVDLRNQTMGFSMLGTLETLMAPEGRTLMILAEGAGPGRALEVLVPEAPLQAELAAFGLRILGLSLIISLVTGAVIYLLLFLVVVRPMRRVTRSVEQFRDDPGAWTRRLPPTARRDEIGRAQNALADMEAAVSDSFRQRARLAELGEAVARIQHDLRGSLAAAQIVSEGLATSDDPRVRRAAPRLERALRRAISLATGTLEYGRRDRAPAQLQTVDLEAVLREAADEALVAHAGIDLDLALDARRTARADPDHLHRIAANLIRNAAEAMQGQGRIAIRADDAGASLRFSDTGPGLPDTLKANLFKPFARGGKAGSTGLGLAIARDLARAMGGDLVLETTGPQGTVFRLDLPA